MEKRGFKRDGPPVATAESELKRLRLRLRRLWLDNHKLEKKNLSLERSDVNTTKLLLNESRRKVKQLTYDKNILLANAHDIDYKITISGLERDNNGLKRDKDRLLKENEELKRENDELKKENKELKERMELKIAVIEKFNSQNLELKKYLEEHADVVPGLKDEVIKLWKEFYGAKSELRLVIEREKKLKEDYDRLWQRTFDAERALGEKNN